MESTQRLGKLDLVEATEEEAKRKREKAGANIPKTVMSLGRLVDSYFGELREAPARGQKLALLVGLPGILTTSQGIPTIIHASYPPYCAARRREAQILQIANEEYGFLPDTCSYIRLHTALNHLWNTGQIERIEEPLRIPQPDIVITGGTCLEHIKLAELVSRNAKCPLLVTDVTSAGMTTESDRVERVRYAVRNVKENVIPAIEKVTGRPYDYDRLSEVIAVIKKVAAMRDEVTELMKTKPTPCSMFDLGISNATFVSIVGRPETIAYYERFLAEVKERVSKGIGVVEPERYRFYWDGYSTWTLLGLVMRAIAPRGGIPVIGTYVIFMFEFAKMLDPERPLETLIEGWTSHTLNLSPWRVNYILGLIEPYSIDALILPSLQTCRAWNVGQEELAELAERKYGIPTLILPVDMTDRTFNNEAQIKVRLEALMEMIDARRRH